VKSELKSFLINMPSTRTCSVLGHTVLVWVLYFNYSDWIFWILSSDYFRCYVHVKRL